MNWNRFAFFAVGVGCFVAAAFLPAVAAPLIVAGAAATGVGVPSETASPLVNIIKSVLGNTKKSNEEKKEE